MAVINQQLPHNYKTAMMLAVFSSLTVEFSISDLLSYSHTCGAKHCSCTWQCMCICLLFLCFFHGAPVAENTIRNTSLSKCH
jgi:hypothetical protein